MPEPHYTQQDLRAAERERILWAMLGANSHTEASQRIAQFLAQRDLIERLEARIEELKGDIAEWSSLARENIKGQLDKI